ncbi:MAG TPA: NAD(P)/FAD-dependent oxidoreductase [Methyloceanibacter sp.]|nr:NAD(P)/FAD-dependent oxidoreductase [Methyloceanibacter sp.]
MSRTPLFAAVKKALVRSFHDNALVLPQSSALTRRRLLRLSAAAAGAAVLSPVLDWSAYAKQERPKGPIAIIGGGVAGLTAAYRLQAAGATPIVFEASNRWGGRMFTQYDFYKGMFCELGGEFVDTNHEDLQKLGAELGVEMQKLVADDQYDDLYFFKGIFHTPKEMVDPEKQTGAFAPIAKRIAKDADKLTDKDENWTSYARKLDKMSLKAYLEQFRGKTDDWAIDLLDVGYNIEYGLETKDQSSLNMVDFITTDFITDMSKPFLMFGESDEVFRIKGGSSALITALVAALENKIEMKQGYALTSLDQKGGKIVLGFDAPGGPASESYEAVILALPFTKLRQVKGLESLRLGADKLKCIRELGMGMNAKILQGTTSRVWRSPDSGLPAPSNGTFYSDLGFQNLWDSSRAQPGEAGLITNYIGVKAGLGDAKSALDAFRADLPKMSPKMAEAIDPNAVVAWFWSVYPFTLGSYAGANVGQYTTLLEVASEPALDGRLQFAGEHTSSDFLGFMNGGVESGNRAAAALVEVMALQK